MVENFAWSCTPSNVVGIGILAVWLLRSLLCYLASQSSVSELGLLFLRYFLFLVLLRNLF